MVRSGAVPVILAPSTVLPALSPVSSVYSPAPFLIFAIERLSFCANESSTYAIEPGVDLSLAATPSEPLAPRPPGAFQVLSWSKVQSLFATPARYLVKLSVVPDESDRCRVWIGVAGRVTPLFWLAIAWSFHLVIL